MGATVGSMVSRFRNGDLLVQESSAPVTMLRFRFPYRDEMPVAIQRSESEYVRSVMFEAVHAGSLLSTEGEGKQLQQRRPLHELYPLSKRFPPQYLMSYHSAKLVDPRLEMVNVTRWTHVISDNTLFVSMLSAYLLQEYPGFPVFHKDTFLQALVDGDRTFCSPLLVNALMAEACVRSISLQVIPCHLMTDRYSTPISGYLIVLDTGIPLAWVIGF